jgi:hypothetical protein
VLREDIRGSIDLTVLPLIEDSRLGSRSADLNSNVSLSREGLTLVGINSGGIGVSRKPGLVAD